MKHLKKLQCIAVMFILLTVWVIGVKAEEHKISRTVDGIELGMSLQEVGNVFKMEEKEDGAIVLMRKYKFGDPEQLSRINK